MSTEAIDRTIGELPREVGRVRNRRGRWFFAGFALAVAATVFIGFSRTYYLREVFAGPPLPMLFHVHGALFTAWVLLFITQAILIAQRRARTHRTLGMAAALLVPPMLVTGVMVAILAARGEGPLSAAVARGEFEFALPPLPPHVGMVIPLTSVMLFSIFVAVSVWRIESGPMCTSA